MSESKRPVTRTAGDPGGSQPWWDGRFYPGMRPPAASPGWAAPNGSRSTSCRPI